MSRDDLARRRHQTSLLLELARLGALEHQRLKAALAGAGIEVTPGQSRALMILIEARQALTARQLSDHMGVSEVTVSRFVRGLVSGGWVRRQQDPSDRRRFLLVTTAKARAALPRFIGVSNQLLDQLFDGFSPAEVVRFAGVLRRVRRNLEA